MTLREAREFLTGKKVFVKNKGKEVQEKLFNIGFKWLAQRVYKNRYFLFLYEDLTLTYTNEIEYFYNHEFEEISAEDILNIETKSLPKTWEEFCKKNPINTGDYTRVPNSDKYTLSNRSVADAHLALMKLHQLRDCYRGNINPSLHQYSIIRDLANNLIVIQDTTRFLSFSTRELAEEFLANFKDLIKEAGDLI